MLTCTLVLTSCVTDRRMTGPRADPEPVMRLELTPERVTVVAGQEIVFSVVGLTATGDTGEIEVAWAAARGTIEHGTDPVAEASGIKVGHYLAATEGEDEVVATDSSGVADTSAVTVTAAPVASVEVSPASATVAPGDSVQLTATLRDADGNLVSDRLVSWSSNATDVAGVSDGGMVTGVSVGTAAITAMSEGQSGTASITVAEPPPPGATAEVLVGAGDIAVCDSSGDEETAAILDTIPGTVFTAGDNAYPDGSASDFTDCYDPSWGRHKDRTRPSPGNHDYRTADAAPYFAYFGADAGEPGKGYYSYELGDWHVIALNSEIDMSAGSPQEQWLRADLARATKQCALAYMHRPRFSSGDHGNDADTDPLIQALYDAGVEMVIAGHDHNYERFAPQAPDGTADPVRGIRQFVVGTGGRSLRDFKATQPNSEVRYNDGWGVIKLTLHADGYDWVFIPVSGSFSDSGSGTCH